MWLNWWMCTNILNILNILKFPELFSDEWLKLSELLILAVCNMASVMKIRGNTDVFEKEMVCDIKCGHFSKKKTSGRRGPLKGHESSRNLSFLDTEDSSSK